MVIKIYNYIFFPTRQQPHNCTRFFSLSIHTWHISTLTPNPSTSLSLSLCLTVFNFSMYLSPTTSGPVNVLLSLTLSLYVLLSLTLSLSTYFSLFLSSYARFSLSISKKISFSHYKSTIVNKYYFFFLFSFFLASNLRIWVLKSSTKIGFNT